MCFPSLGEIDVFTTVATHMLSIPMLSEVESMGSAGKSTFYACESMDSEDSDSADEIIDSTDQSTDSADEMAQTRKRSLSEDQAEAQYTRKRRRLRLRLRLLVQPQHIQRNVSRRTDDVYDLQCH